MACYLYSRVDRNSWHQSIFLSFGHCKSLLQQPASTVDSGTAPTASYETALCTTPDVTDASIAPNLRWGSMDSSDKWTAAVQWWEPNQALTFPQQISNFFRGPEKMFCGQTSARDECASDVICNDVKYPAGMFILNSMVAVSDVGWLSMRYIELMLANELRQLNFNAFDSMGRGEAAVATLMGTFSTTFAPVSDADTGAKLLLDLLGLGFALFAAPTWNSCKLQCRSIPAGQAEGADSRIM